MRIGTFFEKGLPKIRRNASTLHFRPPQAEHHHPTTHFSEQRVPRLKLYSKAGHALDTLDCGIGVSSNSTPLSRPRFPLVLKSGRGGALNFMFVKNGRMRLIPYERVEAIGLLAVGEGRRNDE